MHTVELLEGVLGIAEQLGYRIRHEWLGGSGGGACEVCGKKWIFVDLALNAIEQLEQVSETLRADPSVHLLELSPPMREWLEVPRAA